MHYFPDGREIVCLNGDNRYTRALYGTHTRFRMETSDRPVFASFDADNSWNFRFYLTLDGVRKQLDSTSWCEARYQGGRRSYKVRDDAWGKGELRITLLASQFDEKQTVQDMITAKVATIGEKITVRRYVRYQAKDSIVDSYIHMGGKVGVLVEADGPITDATPEVIHNIALQIAAASPVAPEYVRRSEVRAEHLEHEKEILIAQAREEGKPENIIEKMVMGRINKFYQEVCLLEQAYVKDGDLSVQKMIDKENKGLNVVRFTRYRMGDGLEKKVNDLAAEVAEQAAKMGL